jgi:heptose I phosphotransferase
LDNKKNIKIYLIDFHRLEKKTKISSKRISKELGDLLFSIKYFGNEERFQKILKTNYFNKNFLEKHKMDIHERATLMFKKYKNKYA